LHEREGASIPPIVVVTTLKAFLTSFPKRLSLFPEPLEVKVRELFESEERNVVSTEAVELIPPGEKMGLAVDIYSSLIMELTFPELMLVSTEAIELKAPRGTKELVVAVANLPFSQSLMSTLPEFLLPILEFMTV
jgi:hypothetical protein